MCQSYLMNYKDKFGWENRVHKEREKEEEERENKKEIAIYILP